MNKIKIDEGGGGYVPVMIATAIQKIIQISHMYLCSPRSSI